jgi:HAD superfamily hydrolase (TIGR01549 family)
MAFRGILFDIDGTMANTLPICVQSFQMFLEQELGRPFTAQEILGQFGKSEEGILKIYLNGNLQKSLDGYFEMFEKLHRECCEPFPGIRELLEDLRRRGVPTGVVTGKGPRGAEVALRAMDLAQYFPIVEGGVPEGPNKPEAMRIAARRMGLFPGDLVYVGDTPYDVESAFSTGLYPVGAAWAETTTLTGKELHAGKIFSQVSDLASWLDQAFI